MKVFDEFLGKENKFEVSCNDRVKKVLKWYIIKYLKFYRSNYSIGNLGLEFL